MSATKPLIKVEYHSDDDTGMYHIGEIDFGINGGLDDYLRHYGLKGKQDIISTMGYLIYEVERRFRETQQSQTASSTKNNHE